MVDVPRSTVTGMDSISPPRLALRHLKEDLLEKETTSCLDDTSCTIHRTQQSQSSSKFHRTQVNVLIVFLWLVEQEWCETSSGADVGFDESWSWRCVLRFERTVRQWKNNWTSVK